MKCESCGQNTGINYGNSNAVLCSGCSTSTNGVQLMSKRPDPDLERERNEPATPILRGFGGSDYRTSIIVARLVTTAGWVTCVVALIIAFSAFDDAGRLETLALVLALGVLIGGLFLVIAGQTSRAILDTANSANQILQEMRRNAKLPA